MKLERREFLRLSSAAAALAAGGFLPLLAAEKKERRPRPAAAPRSRNIFTEPPAIEPLTGYLPRFEPVERSSMKGGFVATYALVQCLASGPRSHNRVSGSLTVSFRDRTCTWRETRMNRPAGVVEVTLRCAGDLNVARTWRLKSVVQGTPDLAFAEVGTCDGQTMVVKAMSWKQTRRVAKPLIGRWALLPLLAAGKIKGESLEFDMLDGSTLRPDQRLCYAGRISVSVADGKVELDCYVQAGWGILPTHYLVDEGGRVQLITQENVNWALTRLGVL